MANDGLAGIVVGAVLVVVGTAANQVALVVGGIVAIAAGGWRLKG